MRRNTLNGSILLVVALLFASSTILTSASIVIDLKGTWSWTFHYSGDWFHTMVIDNYNIATGEFSGAGYWNNNPSAYPWTVTGTVYSDGSIEFTIVYGGTGNPGYEVYATGMVNPDGTMSGDADTSQNQLGTWTAERDDEPAIILNFPEGSTAVVSVLVLTGSPPCVPELPGVGVTPYVAVQLVSGSLGGTVEVCVTYDDTGIEDENALRLYMGSCVDFNKDGTVNGIDLSLIKKGIKTNVDISPYPWEVSFDVNNDGEVNDVDVEIVHAYMTNGIIVNWGQDGIEDQARLPWIDITTYVDPDANMIYGETDHFSIFRAR